MAWNGASFRNQGSESESKLGTSQVSRLHEAEGNPPNRASQMDVHQRLAYILLPAGEMRKKCEDGAKILLS